MRDNKIQNFVLKPCFVSAISDSIRFYEMKPDTKLDTDLGKFITTSHTKQGKYSFLDILSIRAYNLTGIFKA